MGIGMKYAAPADRTAQNSALDEAAWMSLLLDMDGDIFSSRDLGLHRRQRGLRMLGSALLSVLRRHS